MMKFINKFSKTLTGVFYVLFSSTLYAGAVGSSFTNEHLGDPGTCPSPLVSNPINIATGNKYHKQTVYRDAGNFPLEFTWHYNSRVLGDDGKYRGMWTHSYGQHGLLNLSADTKVEAIELIRADGSYQYVKAGYFSSLIIAPDNYMDYWGFSNVEFPTASFPQTEGEHIFTTQTSLHGGNGNKHNLPASQSTVSLNYKVNCVEATKMTCAVISFDSLVVNQFPSGLQESYSLRASESDPLKYIADLASIKAPTGETHTLKRSTDHRYLKVTHSSGKDIRLDYNFAGFSHEHETLVKHSPYYNYPLYDSLVISGGASYWDFQRNYYGQGDRFGYLISKIVNPSKQGIADFRYYDFYASLQDPVANYDWGSELIYYSKPYEQSGAGWLYNNAGQAVTSYHGYLSSPNDLTQLTNVQNMSLLDRISNLDHHDLRTVTNQYGKSTTYGYAKVGEETKLITVEGNARTNCGESNASYTYYQNSPDTGRVQQVTDAKGFIKEFTYHRSGRINTTTKAKGLPEEQTTTVTWHDDALGLVGSVTKNGLFTEYKYHANNRLREVALTDLVSTSAPSSTEGNTRTWTYSYEYKANTSQEILSQTTINGPRTDVSDKTIINYNELGYIEDIKRVKNDGTQLVTSFSNHNAWGMAETITNENGVDIKLTYHMAKGETTIATMAVGDANPIKYGYTPGADKLLRITYPDNSWLALRYLPNGDEIDYIENNLGERIDYNYNKDVPIYGGSGSTQAITQTIQKTVNGELTAVASTTKVLDALGRIYQLNENGQNTEFNYDLSSNLETLKQIGQHKTDTVRASLDIDYSHNALNQVDSITAPHAGVTDLDYDDSSTSALSKVIDATTRETSYVTNGFGEILQRTSPDSGITDYYYDEAGNINKEIRASGDINQQEIHYEYDTLNRLTKKYYSGSTKEAIYQFDQEHASTTNGQGRLTQAENDQIRSKLYYAPSGELTKNSSFYKTLNRELVTAYNINTNTLLLDKMTYPSGMILIYGRDGLGRITTISYKYSTAATAVSFISNVTYWPFGMVNTIKFANGTTQTFTLNDDYKIDSVEVSEQLMSVNYQAYDDFGNLTYRTWATKNNTATHQYTYDKAHRLDSFNDNTYGYNDIGERASLILNGKVQTYDYTPTGDGMAQLAIPEIGFSQQFDVFGNLSTDSNGKSYLYNVDNRLESVSINNNQQVSYGYDAFGQRIHKDSITANSYFVYGQQGELLAETDGTNWSDYIYINGRLVGRIDQKNSWNATFANTTQAPSSTLNEDGVTVYNDDTEGGDYFTYQTVNNDTVFTATIDDFNASTNGTEVGLEIRSDTTASANFARIAISAKRDIVLLHGDIIIPILLPQEEVIKLTYQDGTGIKVVEFPVGGQTSFKIERSGDQVMLFASADNSNWSQLGANLSLGLSDEALIGFRSQGSIENVHFSSVTTNGAIAEQNNAYAIYTDHLKTPVVITDINGTLVWEAEYDPFGKARLITGLIENNIRFPGQYYDKESGLHYNYFRDYDPELGRYIQSDPIGLAGGINTYGYAYQNPVMNTDPTGLWVPQVIGAVVNIGFELYNQSESGNRNWERIFVAGATGALGGFGSTAVKAIGFGSVAGAINTSYQEIDKVNSGCQDEIDTRKIIKSYILGGLGGALGNRTGEFIKGRYRTGDLTSFSDYGLTPITYGSHGSALGAVGGGVLGNQ